MPLQLGENLSYYHLCVPFSPLNRGNASAIHQFSLWICKLYIAFSPLNRGNASAMETLLISEVIEFDLSVPSIGAMPLQFGVCAWQIA